MTRSEIRKLAEAAGYEITRSDIEAILQRFGEIHHTPAQICLAIKTYFEDKI